MDRGRARRTPYGVDVIVLAWTVGAVSIATIADVEAMIPQEHRDFLADKLRD